MRVKGNKRSKIALLFGFAGATLLATGFFASSAIAQVTGKCENCHTMHNSQDGGTQVHIGAGAGWNPSTNQLTNGDTFGEQSQLLKSNCVGCHSATDATATIINDGNGNKVPIVFNMGGTYPANQLAGGNFNKNTGSADIYGHNVGGIANPDSTIALDAGVLTPPGSQNSCGTKSCHATLALSDADIATGEHFNYNAISQGQFNGCKGCHNKVAHHNPTDPSYRFLGGHEGGVDYVVGLEDPNWEVAPNSTTHNSYKKQTDQAVKDSIGTFCDGCHQDFHAMGGPDTWSGNDNGGDDNTDGPGNIGLISANSASNPWLRHPTNVNIPLDPLGEYVALNGAAYNPAVPVAQDLTSGVNSIGQGDQVMCLSCHRAHASEYPDSLRFNYSSMKAHNGTGSGTGCFFCHTTKDD